MDDKITEQDAMHHADSANDLRLLINSQQETDDSSGSLHGIKIDMD